LILSGMPSSRERLLKVLRGEMPDRVPVSTYELVGWNSRAWENSEPSYRRLMDAIRDKTDCVAMWGDWSPAGLGGFAYTWAEGVPVTEESWADGPRTVTRTVVRTPAGDLAMVRAADPAVHTTWTTEHVCKDAGDVAKVLSIPYQYSPPSFADLPRIRAEVGEKGIIMSSIADPLCVAAELFSMQDYLLFAFTERPLFRRILDAMLPRVMDHLSAHLEASAADLYRICGPEYATPPYLPPAMFREFVVPYVVEMIRLIHSHGKHARLHCHGRIAANLDAIVETGADAIDPAEPPPDGDIILAEIKSRAPSLAVFGNIELKLLERGTEEDVRRAVRTAVEEGKPGGRFCLMPTAAPIDVDLASGTERNYIVMIETALETGGY